MHSIERKKLIISTSQVSINAHDLLKLVKTIFLISFDRNKFWNNCFIYKKKLIFVQIVVFLNKKIGKLNWNLNFRTYLCCRSKCQTNTWPSRTWIDTIIYKRCRQVANHTHNHSINVSTSNVKWNQVIPNHCFWYFVLNHKKICLTTK